MVTLSSCVEAATRLCEAVGPEWGGALTGVLELAAFAYAMWRMHRTTQQVSAVQGKVQHVHEVVKALSTPPPPSPSASSPALMPVVIPEAPVPSDLLSAQVGEQSDRETKP
jgi:hypothetical protein